MSETIAEMVRKAETLASDGRWNDAEQVWAEIRNREPDHRKALFSLGVHALKRGDSGAAIDLLRAARTVAPADRLVLMTLCAACRHHRDPVGELEAIEAALAVDPYYLPALLAKASWYERQQYRVQAATGYANCLKLAPHPSQWPPILREKLEHARKVVTRHVSDYGSFLSRRLKTLRGSLSAPLDERWREAEAILAGAAKPCLSESNQLHVPRLPAIPFFDPEQFDWVLPLQERFRDIRDEVVVRLRESRGDFVPYISYSPGQPVNQWGELNHSSRWSTLHLWRAGQLISGNLLGCPITAAALEAVPLAEIDCLCPNVMFSALSAHTRIPPHHGETNARLIAHLPLIVPPDCRLRVGNEERYWQEGKVLIFDDTIEHEAHNDSDELRIVLIFDIWNPLLTLPEREIVRAMAAAAREYAAQDPLG